MNAQDFRAAGIYDPDAPNAAGRLALLEWLGGRGFTLAELREAHEGGFLVRLASRQVIRPGRRLSLAEVARQREMPLAEVEALYLAIGMAPVAPDTPVVTEAEARVFDFFAAGTTVLGDRPVRRLARVIGAVMARVGEAVAVGRLLRDEGLDELARAQANLFAAETVSLLSAMVQTLLVLHLTAASDRLERNRAGAPDTARFAIGFVDLVGFTTLSRRMAPGELAEVIEGFEEVAHDVATVRRGRVVKFIGDEVMFATAEPAAACDIALALVEAFATDEAVAPRGGIAYGEVLVRGGDYYGPVVNLASRLAELAVPREVLVTTAVAAGAAATTALGFEPAGRRMLRGFDEPVALLSAARRS